ncbi:MAG: ABC transporter permease [Methylococcaceae bacterium]|nr:ABC transporter permease [Methylococcaceae bacterium]
MNTLWNKIWADLWQYKGRTLLAIASIAIGVFCVGTLFGMIDLELDQMDAAHRRSQPSHINLILRNDADLSLIPAIKAIPDIEDVDTLTPLTVRYKLPGKSDWETGTLIFRPPPSQQRYDLTTLTSGEWPSTGQIDVERLSAKHTGLKIRDKVELETLSGAKSFPVTGIARHPFVKPPNFGGQIHFFADVSVVDHFGIKPQTFRQLMVQVSAPYSVEKARIVAHEIRKLLATHHIGVNAVLLQDPEKHWGRPFFAGINGVLKIMALASLVLACVLILNTLSAHMAQQTTQIGIMKSLGANTGTIIKIYLIETLILAFIATFLAVPSAVIAAYLSSCKQLGLFNISCETFVYSPRAVLVMIAGGLLAPLLAALEPILRAATMNVREAIASYGLEGTFGNNFFDRWIENLGARCLSTLQAAALNNLFRRKGRLLLTQSVLIIAGVIFLVLMSLIASINLTLDNEMARSRFAVRLGFSGDQPQQKIIEAASTVTNTQKIEFWQRLPIELLKNGKIVRQKGSLGAQMLAIPAKTAMYRPLIEAGRWFQPNDENQRVVVLSAETAELNGIKAGDFVEIQLQSAKQIWLVVGLYRWLAGNNYAVEPVYAPVETVEDSILNKNLASFALIDAPLTSLADEIAYVHKLKQVFQEKAIPLDVYTTIAKLEQRQFARNQFKPVIGTLSGLAALIAAVGGIGLSGTLAIGVLQRTREIGVLRAIGAPSRAVFQLFLMEGLFHSIVAWLISAPLAFFAAEPIAKELGKTMFGIRLDFMFDLNALGYWLAIVITLAWTASYGPARKATKITVREGLSHY